MRDIAGEHGNKEHERGDDGDEDVEGVGAVERERADHGAHAEHPEDIEDVGTHGIADGEVGQAAAGGGKGRHEFGEGCSEGHEGEADEGVGNAEAARDRGGAVHGDLSAEREGENAEDDPGGGFGDGEFFERLGFAFDLGNAEGVVEENDEECQEDKAVDAVEHIRGGVHEKDVI